MRTLGGKSLVRLAVECALDAGAHPVVSTDIPELLELPPPDDLHGIVPIARPRQLASDTARMVDVVKHAMSELPGDPSDIWVLLQPTAPFRTPKQVKRAIALLEESGADSVVSVVPLPLTHQFSAQFYIDRDRLCDYDFTRTDLNRQQREQTYIRDGTVYAFRRATMEIYGQDVRPLIIDPADSCELDTEADWADCVRRWEAKHGRAVQG